MKERGVETHLVHLAPLFNPIALWRLTRLLVRERVTILQTHGARANFYGRIAGRLAGVPVIISTVHNSLKDYEVRSLRRGLYTFLLRLTLPTCPSDYLCFGCQSSGPNRGVPGCGGEDADGLQRRGPVGLSFPSGSSESSSRSSVSYQDRYWS